MIGLLFSILLTVSPAQARVKAGIDVLAESGYWELQGKRVGLITNQTGINAAGMSTAEILATTPGVTLTKIFSPEHGFTGALEGNVKSSGTLRGIPIISLYSGGMAGMRPKPADLADLDAVVFDIQDIGARFYTYLATMGMALEETAKAKIPLIVLDRPNPITGLVMEGPILEDLGLRRVTATAYYPVPIRHGMTAGEIARLYNAEIRHPGLAVIPLSGWSRGMWFDETGLPWVPPSPNMPSLDAATLYPGIACFEASNISVGRGTPEPFRWIGAPWMDAKAIVKRLKKARLPGVSFSAREYTPTKSVFANVPSRGVRMRITDRKRLRPVEVFLHLAAALRELHPAQIQWRWDEVKRMTGTEAYRALYESGAPPEEMVRLFERGPADFEAIRAPYLLY